MSSRLSDNALADRVRRVEDRLERLVAVGWRNAEADRAALRAEIPRLEALGLPELAGQARAVVDAGGEGFLLTSTQALHFTRLLRARLAEPAVPPGAWEPFPTARRRRSARSLDRVVPIGRVPLGGGEVWACGRPRGTQNDWILIEPWSDEVGTPWLAGMVGGRLRWRGRYPLGAAGEVTLAELTEPHRLVISDEEQQRPLAVFYELLGENKPFDSVPLVGVGARVQVTQASREDAAGYAWPDPAMARAFVVVASEPVWVVAATDGRAWTPLVVVNPPGTDEAPSLVHLVEGNPREKIVFGE
ncbi:MAG TPA: hypothetical protein VFZ25_04275 [Chloroflexota bacterium]|nr:hypothetical protein [Chloroflexota bacterium]